MSRRVNIFGASFASGPTFPLDPYPNWAMAHSDCRRLATAYTGPIIRARAGVYESDISAGVDGLTDEAALTAFLNGNDGFMPVRYDQTGNGRDSNNTVALQQPQIGYSGVPLQLNGLQSSFWSGTKKHDITSGLDLLRNTSGAYVCAVVKWDTTPSVQQNILNIQTPSAGFGRLALAAGITANRLTSFGRRLDADSALIATSSANLTTATTIIEVSVDYVAREFRQYINGFQDGQIIPFQTSGNTSDTDSGFMTVGAIRGGSFFTAFMNGYITEIFVRRDTFAADRAAFVSALKTFHGIP